MTHREVTGEPPRSLSGPHLTFEDEVTALQPQVDELRRMGVNKIVALGHSGFLVDQDIARRVRGVDVVVGGHSNTFLYTGEGASPVCPDRRFHGYGPSPMTQIPHAPTGKVSL